MINGRVTFDLHYHTNVYRMQRWNRDRRLAQHRKCLGETGVDYVASTEHAYKAPLDAYLYLRDAVLDLPTEILPAVEAISEEGVDIIFIYPDEDALRSALRVIQPFKWKAQDMGRLGRDTGAIVVIPHPFTPGRTGTANVLGSETFMQLQEEVDYIEVHNGLSLHFLENGMRGGKAVTPPKLQKSVEYTYRLPDELRLNQIGWAVSSDAHFPSHQTIVGGIETADGQRPSDWFSFLKQRHHFKETEVRNHGNRNLLKLWHGIESSYCTFGEAVEKKAQRAGLTAGAKHTHPDAA
ncbi:hypothetical protein [Aestuariispira insulae]|uniref:PHP domain-containing protein n=1 Tax=Aestuariispira insulae TaxID=1461337 RepID=A0A3D9HRI0_9PROT|nr:hypothetical protein [Aestuariispira insulae]RED52005.1 hypothetical protein DFP90_10221 [Aestuariispira insulae]